MLRAANHSSYPRIGESSLDQQLRHTLHARDRGEIGQAEVAAVEDEVATIVLAEQSRAFIDIVTDGLVRWEGPLSHVARHLDGLEARDLVRWFDTNFYDRRPEVVGPIRRTTPFLVHDYQVAIGVTPRLVKMVLPGPVTFARLAKDSHYGSLERVAEDLAAALAEEVADLAALGCRCFQVEEPLLCRFPEDLELVARTGRRIVEAAGGGSVTIFSTYFGDLAAVAARDGGIASLPGSHLGLDMVTTKGNFPLIERIPVTKGLALGLFDARTTRLEDAADVATDLAPYRDALQARDVHVGPNAGLELLPRSPAFDKLLQARYLVEKLNREWTWVS